MNIRHLTLAIVCTLFSLPHMAQKKVALQLQHVEPMNWWVGMNNPNLQLLVHAPRIAETVPVIEYEGVTVKEVIHTSNPNYLFINLEIAPETQAGSFDIVFNRLGVKIASYNYQLKARKEGSAQRMGFTADDAIMLLMPDRFANGNTANDNIEGMKERADRNKPYGRHGGDLKGISDNLDYFTDLGMTTLWLNPVQENDMPESSYHGYAITDYYAVDRRLGSLEEYKALAEKMHSKGLKLVMDMVFNHCGTEHWWMKDLPCEDWIFQWGGKYQNSSFRLSTVADPHVSKRDLRITTEGWFDKSMADMNMRNPLVRNYLIQNSIWWIEEIGLDGIRQDTYPYPDKEAMREWNIRVRQEYPNFNIVGEVWISHASKLFYWQKDALNKDGFNSELPTIMDFPLQEAICKAFTEVPGWDTGIMRLYDALANDHLYANTQNIMVFGENHDVGRLLNQVGMNVDNLKLATAFLATVRGIPQLYIGTEILMSGNGFDGHCFIREDFPGGWEGDKANYFTSRPQAADEMYHYTARLFNYRKTSDAIRNGKLTHFLPENEVYVFFRHTDNEKVMVILNNNKEPQTVNSDTYSEILSPTAKGKDIISGKTFDTLSSISIPGKSAMVIECSE